MKVLLVEDEPKLARAVQSGLQIEGYVVEQVSRGEDALNFLEYDHFDVVILDRMLDGAIDGIEVCRTMRTKSIMTPVIMLTALNEVSNRIEGLDIGADDYLGKPFDFDELLARVRSLVRRPTVSVGPVFTRGELSIDTSNKNVVYSQTEVALSRKEYSLLEYLVINTGTTLSKEQIIERVWDFDADILPNTVEATIKNIRKKLVSAGAAKGGLIETVRGFGYRVPQS